MSLADFETTWGLKNGGPFEEVIGDILRKKSYIYIHILTYQRGLRFPEFRAPSLGVRLMRIPGPGGRWMCIWQSVFKARPRATWTLTRLTLCFPACP